MRRADYSASKSEHSLRRGSSATPRCLAQGLPPDRSTPVDLEPAAVSAAARRSLAIIRALSGLVLALVALLVLALVALFVPRPAVAQGPSLARSVPGDEHTASRLARPPDHHRR